MHKYDPQITDIVEFIESNDNFMLAAHINADGDAYASAIAMYLLLRHLGRNVLMIFSDADKPDRYEYMKAYKDIQHYRPNFDVRPFLNGNSIQAAFVLDVPSFFRLGKVKEILPAKNKVVKIDHHPLEEVMGGLEWIAEDASSTTSMVYALYERLQVTPDLEMAKAIYSGILYDTGRFSFSNTTARDYEIAARMVQLGVQPAEITNRVFFENNLKALKTIGIGLASLQSHLNGRVHSIYLDNQQLLDQEQSEIEELANFSISIRGGEVGLFIREVEPGFHKISLRSREFVDVNQVAKAFNGGGHSRAAGCRISGDRQIVLSSILAEIEKQLS